MYYILMRASTPVRTGVRAVASSWKPRVISSNVDGHGWTDGRPMPGLVEWMKLCFNHPVCHLLFSLSPLLLPPSPSPCTVFVYRNEPCAPATFMTDKLGGICLQTQ